MKKRVLGFIYVLAAIAIISVGFAAWIISVPAEQHTTGNITVDTITDKRITIDGSVDESVIFGYKKSDVTDPWLLSDSIVDTENLTVTLNFTVSDKDGGGSKYFNEYNYQILLATEEDEDGDGFKHFTNWNLAVSKNYVMDLDEVLISDINWTSNTASVTLTFAWGSAFDNKNPYAYFNALSADDYAQEAKETLSELNTLLSGCKFVVTIKATPKTYE